MKLEALALAIAAGFALAAGTASATTKTATVTDIQYADRPECLLDLRYPVGETNFPTVVWFHGGGLTDGSRGFIPLADEKIAQATADYRLLRKETRRGEDCIEDAAAAVAWTLNHIAEYGGDSEKVFVAGLSAGGYLAMMVGMDPRWLGACGRSNLDLAGICAVSGQATKHYNVRKFSGDRDSQFIPKIDDMAPLAHVGKDIPPLLCVCGEPPYENKCRAEENRLLVSSCEALGHPWARYVECPLCDHFRVAKAALPYLELFVSGSLP